MLRHELTTVGRSAEASGHDHLIIRIASSANSNSIGWKLSAKDDLHFLEITVSVRMIDVCCKIQQYLLEIIGVYCQYISCIDDNCRQLAFIIDD